MAKNKKKQEALSVGRLINEVLVAQLSIPFRQIVNDTTFSKYTGSKRPDILISKFEIALKECGETEAWLKLLFNTNVIDEVTYKNYRNLCGRIRRILISSCKTLKENSK